MTDQQKDISQRYSFKGEELKLGLEGTPVLDSANGSGIRVIKVNAIRHEENA